jgi:hypothetical protein
MQLPMLDPQMSLEGCCVVSPVNGKIVGDVGPCPKAEER